VTSISDGMQLRRQHAWGHAWCPITHHPKWLTHTMALAPVSQIMDDALHLAKQGFIYCINM